LILAVSVCAIVLLAKHILMAVGLYKIAVRRKVDSAFLAFIPVVNSYILGAVYDDINKTMNKTSKNAVKLLALNLIMLCVGLLSFPFIFFYLFVSTISQPAVILSVIASLIFAMHFVLYVIYYVYFYAAVYGIYKEYAYNNAILYLIISILFMPITSLLLFLICNNESGYELWKKQREQQRYSPNEAHFEEEFAETSVEEVFTDDAIPSDDGMEQTVIDDNNEETPDF